MDATHGLQVTLSTEIQGWHLPQNMSNQSISENAAPALCLIYFEIIIPTVCTIILITMLPTVYKYIKSDKLKNQYPFWGGLIFIITIFFAIVIVIFHSIYWCRHSKTFTIFANLFSQLYSIQTGLLIGLLLARLHFVFDGTVFALSKLTVKLHLIYYALSMIVMIVDALFIATLGIRFLDC